MGKTKDKFYKGITNRYFKRKRFEIALQQCVGRKILDVGARDAALTDYFLEHTNLIKNLYNIHSIDVYPTDERVEACDILNNTFTDNEFETVICLEVIEHTVDPVAVMRELLRIASKQIILSTPIEPWHSLARLGWKKDHLWALTPPGLKYHLGEPDFEITIVKAYYMADWRFNR